MYYVIDLSKYEKDGFVVGLELVQEIYKKENIEAIFKDIKLNKCSKCTVLIDNRVLGVSSVLFSNLFYDIVRYLGKEKFLEIFKFTIPKDNNIYKGILYDIDIILKGE